TPAMSSSRTRRSCQEVWNLVFAERHEATPMVALADPNAVRPPPLFSRGRPAQTLPIAIQVRLPVRDGRSASSSRSSSDRVALASPLIGAQRARATAAPSACPTRVRLAVVLALVLAGCASSVLLWPPKRP